MNRTTIIVACVGLILAGTVGYFAYTRGVDAGRAQANDIRNEFFAARGIAQPGAGGAVAFGGGQASGGGGAGFAGGGGAGFAGGGGRSAGGQNAPAASVATTGAGAPTFGRIQEVTADTLVLASRDGGTQTIKLADNTLIARQARADRGQLKDGVVVQVVGETGADGVVAARVVTIMGGGPGNETGLAPNSADGAAAVSSR